MKKLNKRARVAKSACTVQRYVSCMQAVQDYCSAECRRLGSDNYGMTFPRAEMEKAVRE